ncbi:hypothetical protein NLG97_g11371 [Lecanicillium saksenae]|uniref:Uncharacterized protein n=1 Tax=Lecanicillium saksenae TaxID=468837 RepID=A0ACC1QC90_9HYPO|nr:hypothetical protein NLG97_g11371 [Lecanicillium saksenae]
MVNLFSIGLASEFAASSVRDDNGETVFTSDELRWFSTNSYNLGVIHVTSWEPGRLASLFKSCLVFTQAALSSDADAVDAAQDTFIMLRCHFILASLYISEAQIIKNEHTQSLYADVEHHATEFVHVLVHDQGSAAANCPDLLQKLGILCAFQFEALLYRQFFDHLPCVIKQARLCKDANVLKALGGCLIRSDAPVQVKSSLLKSIVNETFEVEKFDSARLAQYLRCMVHVLLPLVEHDFLALELLDQAIVVADQSKEVRETKTMTIPWSL